ncbi:hypothetical protein RP20_CCG016981 [Aedes albopictus]|nr:LOW QUALITY PROTEIN: F-box only protein 39 [Aedes albopictus]KXJ84014.1 hypothetical protein RP20_CCG016981 [Aedes albopictus]
MEVPEEQRELPDLPSDVVLMIFDHLNFRSRLTASLVCRQWNQLAFAAKFMNRLCLSLDIRNLDGLASAGTVLQSSNRPYKHMRIVFQGCRQQSLYSVVQLLHPMHGLLSLEMVFYFYCFQEKLHIVLQEVLENRPSLTALSFEIRGRLMNWGGLSADLLTKRSSSVVIDVDEEQKIFPSLTSLTIKRNPDMFNPRFFEMQVSPSYLTFHSPPKPEIIPNLRHLTMTCETDEQLQLFSSLSEQLETVSVISFDPHGLQIESFLELSFPQLLDLKICPISLPHFNAMVNFVRKLRRIRILQLEEVLIDSEIIDAIFENCTELRQLGLHMDSLDAGCLRNISILKNLERLIMIGRRPVKYGTYEDYFRGGIGQLLNLKSLSFQRFSFPSNAFVSSLARMMCNLEELRLHECRAKNNIIGPIFDHFPGLTRLEFVKVTHGGARPIWPPMLVNVRLINCAWVTSDHLTKLIQRCPNLRHLNIYGCGTSKDMLQKIAEIVPAGCFVERTHNFAPSVARMVS